MIYRIWDLFVIMADMFLFLFYINKMSVRKDFTWKSFQPAIALDACLLLYIFQLLNFPFMIVFAITFLLHLTISLLFLKGTFFTHFVYTLFFSVFSIVAVLLTYWRTLYMQAPFHEDSFLLPGIPRVVFTALCVMTLSLFVLLFIYLVKEKELLRLIERILFCIISLLCVILEHLQGQDLISGTLFLAPYDSLDHVRPPLHNFFLLFILFYVIAFFCSHLAVQAHSNRLLTEENLLAKISTAEYEHVLAQVTELRMIKHDIANHMQTLSALIQKNESQEALDYINRVGKELSENHILLSSGNLPVDCILSNKILYGQSKNIRIKYSVLLPGTLPLSNVDVCSLLGNLFDNAIEACEKLQAKEKKEINLCIKPFQDMLSIKITNASNGIYKKDKNNQFHSTKSDSSMHGIGIKQIEKIVTKYGGFSRFCPGADNFIVDILIPLHSTTVTPEN